MRRPPWATTCVRGREVASTSKRPLTILRSGEMERRYSYVGLSVRLPRQRDWEILPGARSFLNCETAVSVLSCSLPRGEDRGGVLCVFFFL